MKLQSVGYAVRSITANVGRLGEVGDLTHKTRLELLMFNNR